jgi:chromosome segregation ATPase
VLKQLQAQIETEEESLQTEIEGAITDIEETSQDSPQNIKTALQSAIETLKDTEEAELMKKRYAQLQAQLAILQANLSARYGERYEDVKQYLDDAKTWYDRATPKAEAMAENVKEKHNQFETKLKDAGTATAQREKRVKQMLKELWQIATETFKDGKSQ